MNRTTRITAAAFGTLLGLSGMNHGFFEALHGNHPTGGLLISAISAGHSWTRWTQGGEGAFTLVPNFLATGLLAMALGLAIAIWSIGYFFNDLLKGVIGWGLLLILVSLPLSVYTAYARDSLGKSGKVFER